MEKWVFTGSKWTVQWNIHAKIKNKNKPNIEHWSVNEKQLGHTNKKSNLNKGFLVFKWPVQNFQINKNKAKAGLWILKFYHWWPFMYSWIQVIRTKTYSMMKKKIPHYFREPSERIILATINCTQKLEHHLFPMMHNNLPKNFENVREHFSLWKPTFIFKKEKKKRSTGHWTVCM